MTTPKLGGIFLRCAMGPLHYAGGCILAGKVADGLRELTADNLHGGFKRGVEEAARHVGVEPSEIERLLPIADVVVAAARLNSAQAQADTAWATFAGAQGGLLPGVGDLTVDGRAPDVSAFLERLAKKVSRDPVLSDPLHALALAVARWTDLVEQSSECLANGDVLARAYRARRIRRALPIVLLAVVALATVPWALGLRAARARIDEALAAEDPCAGGIAPDDESRATEAQRLRATSRAEACAARRKAEADAAEAKRVRDEKAAAAARAARDHEARCSALADHVDLGDLKPEDTSLAEGKEALLVRIARKSLTAEDVAEASLPCAATTASARLAKSFELALLRSPAAWANADDVSPAAAAILVAHKSELASAPKYALVAHADKLVKKAMIVKNPAVTEAATRVCKLKDDIDARGGHYCVALGQLRASGKL